MQEGGTRKDPSILCFTQPHGQLDRSGSRLLDPVERFDRKRHLIDLWPCDEVEDGEIIRS